MIIHIEFVFVTNGKSCCTTRKERSNNNIQGVCVGVCTCAVSSVVEVDSKSARLVLSLPRHRRAVLVVGVGVVVVNIPDKRPQKSQSCHIQTGDTDESAAL